MRSARYGISRIDRGDVGARAGIDAIPGVLAIGFGKDSTTTPRPALQIAELAPTWIFITEFTVRIAAGRNRGRYVRDHVLDPG